MTKRLEVYKCEVCGNIISIVIARNGTLVCCDEPMKLMVENTVDAALEKHVPVLEKTADGYIVKVGQVLHPMEEKHWIQWIELITDNGVCRRWLSPGDKPEAFFKTDAQPLYVREYCNLHGFWKK